MIAIVGGKADGHQSPMKLLQMELEGEKYILLQFADGKIKGYFYMLAGAVPAEAYKIWKDRQKVEKGIWPPR